MDAKIKELEGKKKIDRLSVKEQSARIHLMLTSKRRRASYF
jgi:hypothetical protein